MRSYAAALLGWIVGALAAPLAAFFLLALVFDAICGDATDCSWGFGAVLILPVVLVSLLRTGPWLVGRLLARWVHPGANHRGERAARWAAGLSIVVLGLAAANGVPAFARVVAVVVLGVPRCRRVVDAVVRAPRRRASPLTALLGPQRAGVPSWRRIVCIA